MACNFKSIKFSGFGKIIMLFIYFLMFCVIANFQSSSFKTIEFRVCFFKEVGPHLKDGLDLQKYCQSANYLCLSSINCVLLNFIRFIQCLTKAGDTVQFY